MKAQKLVVGLMAAFLLTACTTTRVVTDQNAQYNFDGIKTYMLQFAFESEKENVIINDLNRNRIEKSLNNDLATRGLEQSDTPDVIIVYNLSIDQTKNYSTTGSYYGTGRYGRRGYYGGSYGHGHSNTTEYITTNGILSISMHQPDNDELLWYSAGTKELDLTGNKKEQKLNEAVALIMNEFPVKQLQQVVAQK